MIQYDILWHILFHNDILYNKLYYAIINISSYSSSSSRSSSLLLLLLVVVVVVVVVVVIVVVVVVYQYCCCGDRPRGRAAAWRSATENTYIYIYIHSCHILPFQPILWNKYFPPESAKTAKHSPKSNSEEGRIWQVWDTYTYIYIYIYIYNISETLLWRW